MYFLFCSEFAVTAGLARYPHGLHRCEKLCCNDNRLWLNLENY